MNGKLTTVKIDTGAEVNVIPKAIFKQIGLSTVTTSMVTLKGYTCQEIQCIIN